MKIKTDYLNNITEECRVIKTKYRNAYRIKSATLGHQVKLLRYRDRAFNGKRRPW